MTGPKISSRKIDIEGGHLQIQLVRQIDRFRFDFAAPKLITAPSASLFNI